MQGPPLQTFSLKNAIEAWWISCKTAHRPPQGPRQQYTRRITTRSTSTRTLSDEDEDQLLSLSEWDTLFKVQSEGNSSESED